MKKVELADITQEDFDEAAAVVSSGIKAYNRKLDTRDGTVLRDLLVNPEAAIESVTSAQIEEARKSSSLKMMEEAQESGEEIDSSDVDAILSNFNLKPSSGTKARGIVKVVVSDGTVAYSVSKDSIFETTDGVRFVSDEQVVAMPDTMNNPTVRATTKLYEGAAGYFFLIPVTAVETGSSGNIEQGTSITPVTRVTAFVMAEAYKNFDGGSDVQSLSSVIDSIPSGLSIRGFVNKTAVEGMLRDEFDAGDYPIVAVSSVGYGNAAQRRDKHNVFGVGVGGRIDVYVRNFSDIFTKTAILKGEPGENPGEYRISIPAGMFPGACWVKSVSDPFTTSDSEDVLDSLAFEAKRTADVSGVWHDIDVSKSPEEAFNTIWQGFDLTLSDVPEPEEAIPEAEEEEEEETEEPEEEEEEEVEEEEVEETESSSYIQTTKDREFKVTVYCLPLANDLQSFVDRDDVRSVSTDVVVRCPIICNVSVNAVVQYDPKKPIDEGVAKTRIRSYINGLGFVGRLTRSEIVYILKELGAVSVDMPNKDMLYGTLHDAYGVKHVLSGDALDVSTIMDGSAMLSKDTVVFAAEDGNIQIKMVPNS